MSTNKSSPTHQLALPVETIARRIYLIRDQKVMLDSDLAELYGVATKVLNQAVRRNRARFPQDFMFQLNAREAETLRSQIVTSSGHGGRRYLPYVFTEQGVAMLSSVLNSERAVQVNIAIMRAFVQLRRELISRKDLAAELEGIKQDYNGKFAVVFKALDKLLAIPKPRRGSIGFRTGKHD